MIQMNDRQAKITFKNKFYLDNSIIVHIDYKKHIC